MSRRPAVVLAAVALVGVAAGCGQEEESRPITRPGTVTIDDEAATDRGTADVPAGETLEMEAGDFYFAPTVITGPGGEDVEVTVTNRSGTVHNVSLDVQGVDQDLNPGSTASVTLRFPSSGTEVFYCKFHRDRRMLGALVAT